MVAPSQLRALAGVGNARIASPSGPVASSSRMHTIDVAEVESNSRTNIRRVPTRSTSRYDRPFVSTKRAPDPTPTIETLRAVWLDQGTHVVPAVLVGWQRWSRGLVRPRRVGHASGDLAFARGWRPIDCGSFRAQEPKPQVG